MRFTKIQFEKVGPFTNTTLDFQTQAKLHLIHGPNEAGKSSALKQMLGFLFGFEERSGDDFAHKYNLHRVTSHLAYSLKDPLGPVVRKRGRGATLEGAEEKDLHPGHIGRDEYDQLFAIDQVRLRKGSDDLFAGKSDLKTILFESMTGMSSVSSIRKEIQEQKEKLLKTRSGLIQDLIKEVGDIRDKIADILSKRDLKGTEVREYQETCANLVRSEGDLKKYRQEKSRLERLLRGLGTFMQLRLKESEINQMMDLPQLGSNFQKEWDQVRQAKAGLESGVAEAAGNLRHLTEQIQLVPESQLDAALRGRIEVLIQQIKEVEGAFRDLPEQLRLRDSLTKQIQDWVEEWFPSKIGQNLLDWLPNERQINQISQAATELQSAQSAVGQATRNSESARQNLTNLETEANQLPLIEDLNPLVLVLEKIEHLGFNEKTLKESDDSKKREREAVLAQARRLVPPVENEEALGRISTPTQAEIQEVVEKFKNLETKISKIQDAIATHTNELVVSETELQQYQAGGVGKVSRADYESTKDIRDKAWNLIRAERKGMIPDTEIVRNLIRDAGTWIDLDESLTGLMGRADQQAESLLTDAEKVSKCELLRQKIGSLKQVIADLEKDLSRKNGRREELREAFNVQWSGWNAGPVAIGNINGLPEWMKKVSDLREAIAKSDSQLADNRTKWEELETLRKNLVQLLGCEGTVVVLRETAKSKIQANEKRAKENASVTSSLNTQKRNDTEATNQLNEAKQKLENAKTIWADLTGPLGDPVQQGETVALAGHLKNVRSWDSNRATAARRVHDMQTTLERFLQDLAEATGKTEIGNGPWDQTTWRGALNALQSLLTKVQSNETGKKELENQRNLAQLNLLKNQTDRDQNRIRFGELLRQANCADENDVQSLVERVARKTVLESEISGLRSQLVNEMKMNLEDYIVELGDQKGPELERKTQDLDQESDRLEHEIQSLRRTKQQMESVLGDLVRSDEAAVFRQKLEDAKVRLGEAVRVWKLQHLSLLCLNQAIEKNRQSNSQSPLARAASFFQRMTLGRFEDVRFEDDGKELLLKVRRKGAADFMELSATQGNGLSEGTADQLWLALRLAGIEARVDQMNREGQSPLPVILDDVLITFDNDRTKATLELLAELGEKTQVLVFTHHTHVCALASEVLREKVDVVELVAGPAGSPV